MQQNPTDHESVAKVALISITNTINSKMTISKALTGKRNMFIKAEYGKKRLHCSTSDTLFKCYKGSTSDNTRILVQ